MIVDYAVKLYWNLVTANELFCTATSAERSGIKACIVVTSLAERRSTTVFTMPFGPSRPCSVPNADFCRYSGVTSTVHSNASSREKQGKSRA
jgi:hypothetical protein